MFLVLMERGGELHTTKILVVFVHGFVIHVPDDEIGNQRLYPYEQILIIYRTVHPVLAERRKRDDGHPLSIFIPHSFRDTAVGFPARAALRKPCGVSQTSSCRTSAAAGTGRTPFPCMFQA